jgi:hypothetical protein
MSSPKNKFLAGWNSTGLQVVFNVTKTEKEAAWAKLSGKKYVWPYSIPMLKTQAHLSREFSSEVYIFESEKSIDSICEDFTDNPQPLVDWIRQNGECIYSNYRPDARKIK